jgi:hypothetical protein
MDLSQNAGAPEVEALDKLESVLEMLSGAEVLVGQALERLPDAAGVEYVQLRIRDAMKVIRAELKASGRTPAQPGEARSICWPT